MTPVPISNESITAAVRRACDSLTEQADHLTQLDQAMGDGDTGITLTKAANALIGYVDENSIEDIGTYLAGAGMAVNRAAPSTLGTLTATALMSAGKTVKGQEVITVEDTVAMFNAAVVGIQKRGKANLGDKTLLDAMHPAAEAYGEAVAAGVSMSEAGAAALRAAEEGHMRVVPLRSKIGRASWLGEHSEGRPDPGCEAFAIALRAIVGEE